MAREAAGTARQVAYLAEAADHRIFRVDQVACREAPEPVKETAEIAAGIFRVQRMRAVQRMAALPAFAIGKWREALAEATRELLRGIQAAGQTPQWASEGADQRAEVGPAQWPWKPV